MLRTSLGHEVEFSKIVTECPKDTDFSYYIRMEGFAKEFVRNFSSYDFELIFRRE